MEKTFLYTSDPGHGYLRVSMKDLESLGIVNEISGCSFKKGGYAYLEEDCDAPLFVKTWKERGNTIKFNVKRINSPAKCRTYERFGG